MLTYEDCLALCDLTGDEIGAIAEHEHIHDLIAIELGEYLVHTGDGERKIHSMILEVIEAHRLRGDLEGVERLELVLRYFVATHPKSSENA